MSKQLVTQTDLDFSPDYYVYTDGSCSNNGKRYSVAGIGVFFGVNDERNISQKVEGKQTNNTAELGAIIEAYRVIENDVKMGKKIIIVSDSEYAIKCATSYGEKCYKKGWDVDIPNKILVKTVYEMYKDKDNIKFMHIMAHTANTDIHSIGNDHADRLANMSLGLSNCPYNNGSIENSRPKLSKLYLKVPYEKKDLVKALGAMWDFRKKKWYIHSNNKNKEEINAIINEQCPSIN